MGRGHLVNLALCRSQWRIVLAIAVDRDAPGSRQCNVCLHLAFLRQSHLPRLARHPPSRHDCHRKRHLMRCHLVDLALNPRSQNITLLLSSLLPMSKDTLFALSLFPYLGFLWFLTRSGKTPRLALIGFYMTLVFVAVTIPAGIYAKVAYGEQLANVDWLHGSAEFFLTLSNILVVLGFRQAIIEKQGSIKS